MIFKPVIVISHGLGSRPEDLVKRAEFFASHDYVVALPQHPGSDMIQLQNMHQGLSRNVFFSQDFIDAPLDISYVLYELERRNQTEFSGRLNVQSVGVIEIFITELRGEPICSFFLSVRSRFPLMESAAL